MNLSMLVVLAVEGKQHINALLLCFKTTRGVIVMVVLVIRVKVLVLFLAAISFLA